MPSISKRPRSRISLPGQTGDVAGRATPIPVGLGGSADKALAGRLRETAKTTRETFGVAAQSMRRIAGVELEKGRRAVQTINTLNSVVGGVAQIGMDVANYTAREQAKLQANKDRTVMAESMIEWNNDVLGLDKQIRSEFPGTRVYDPDYQDTIGTAIQSRKDVIKDNMAHKGVSPEQMSRFDMWTSGRTSTELFAYSKYSNQQIAEVDRSNFQNTLDSFKRAVAEGGDHVSAKAVVLESGKAMGETNPGLGSESAVRVALKQIDVIKAERMVSTTPLSALRDGEREYLRQNMDTEIFQDMLVKMGKAEVAQLKADRKVAIKEASDIVDAGLAGKSYVPEAVAVVEKLTALGMPEEAQEFGDQIAVLTAVNNMVPNSKVQPLEASLAQLERVVSGFDPDKMDPGQFADMKKIEKHGVSLLEKENAIRNSDSAAYFMPMAKVDLGPNMPMSAYVDYVFDKALQSGVPLDKITYIPKPMAGDVFGSFEAAVRTDGGATWIANAEKRYGKNLPAVIRQAQLPSAISLAAITFDETDNSKLVNALVASTQVSWSKVAFAEGENKAKMVAYTKEWLEDKSSVYQHLRSLTSTGDISAMASVSANDMIMDIAKSTAILMDGGENKDSIMGQFQQAIDNGMSRWTGVNGSSILYSSKKSPDMMKDVDLGVQSVLRNSANVFEPMREEWETDKTEELIQQEGHSPKNAQVLAGELWKSKMQDIENSGSLMSGVGGKVSLHYKTIKPSLRGEDGSTIRVSFTLEQLADIGRGEATKIEELRERPPGKKSKKKSQANAKENAWKWWIENGIKTAAEPAQKDMSTALNYSMTAATTSKLKWWMETEDTFAGGQ